MIYLREMSNHLMCVCRFFGDAQTSGLIGKVRRDWEEGLWYGVKMNHMLTLESLERSFFYIYYTSLHLS